MQKLQILMPKTQQFIKGVKGVRFTRLKQQIFFTYEHSMMTVGTMGRPYKAIYLMHWEIETTISDKRVSILHNLDDIANFHNRDPETQSLPGLRPKAFVQSGEQWHSMTLLKPM